MTSLFKVKQLHMVYLQLPVLFVLCFLISMFHNSDIIQLCNNDTIVIVILIIIIVIFVDAISTIMFFPELLLGIFSRRDFVIKHIELVIWYWTAYLGTSVYIGTLTL